ncbi:MAG: 30S ribosomal protein S7 [Candidatus Omnitrophica bacterium CG11_big_fil_rev_8_21_14_0_20_41_12]|nr:MAG: 30S ribosomal protein S7 [Candidatus Omnitrophica bacterium CG11_big_fil_rev_8_21_14_0_20_41_12]
MMRRRKAQEKVILADPKYNSKIIAKFMNMVMVDGKKSIAEKIVYSAFDIVLKNLNEEDILKVFYKALDNARPRLEVKPRRVGGATYQVPVEVRQERGTSIALRWIRDFAQTKKGKSMEQKLAEEIISAFKGEGAAIKKRDDTHKMAESNKAYAHFRW